MHMGMDGRTNVFIRLILTCQYATRVSRRMDGRTGSGRDQASFVWRVTTKGGMVGRVRTNGCTNVVHVMYMHMYMHMYMLFTVEVWGVNKKAKAPYCNIRDVHGGICQPAH